MLLAPSPVTFVAGLAAHATHAPLPKTVLIYGAMVALPAFTLAAIMVFAVSFAEGLLSRWRLRLAWAETAVALALVAITILLAKHNA